MKKTITRAKLFALISVGFCSATLATSLLAAFHQGQEKENEPFVAYGLDIADEDTQYLGYGYDVASGKAISDPNALNLANPILDVDNPELIKYEKAFSSSQTTYLSYSSSSSREMAEEYGMSLGGGVKIISPVTVNISARFNTNTKFAQKAQEEYSYYSIYAKNRTVVLQAGADVLSQYLNPLFLRDAKNINDEGDADNFFSKYGTHLVTGYNLGGIFEMTNYYASSSSSYVRQNEVSFSSQVEAAFGAYGGGVDFSFSSKYGSLDNNAYAVNNYKCTTYGGYTFAGLTIDQAFSFYQTAFGAGYIYGLWTDSINAGKNLSIVGIPESSAMIPLYNILPDGHEYDDARNYLLTSYIKKCGLAYAEFLEKYPEINPNFRPTKLSPSDLGYDGYGYSSYKRISGSQFSSTFVSSDDYTDSVSVRRDDIIAMSYNQSIYYGYNVEWKANSGVTVLDKLNGVFQIDDDAALGEKQIWLEVGGDPDQGIEGQRLYSLYLNVKESRYSAGVGTDSNPYLLTSADDLYFLMNPDNKADWNKSFKLMNDIDLEVTEGVNNRIHPIGSYIGSELYTFSGTFDGNYHSIRHFRLFKNSLQISSAEKYLGLFGRNEGTIKNLTLEAYKEGEDSNVDYNSNRNVIANFTSELHTFDNKNDSALYSFIPTGSSATVFAQNVQYVGGIVGLNNGVLENCSVKNLDIRYLESRRLAGMEEVDSPAIGAVCGQNDEHGILDNCSSEECTIRAYQYTKKDGYNYMMAGGIVGNNINTDSEIHNCYVNKLGIQSFMDDYYSSSPDKTKFTYIGGIVGATNSPIHDCLVKNIDGKNPSHDYNNDKVPYSLHGYIRGKNDSVAYTSIMAGASRFSSAMQYSRLVGLNCTSVAWSYIDTDRHEHTGSSENRVACFVTFRDRSASGVPAFEDCYLNRSSDTELFKAVTSTSYSTKDTTTAITYSEGLTWNKLSEAITDSSSWRKDEYSLPELVLNIISLDDLQFDFSNAKKVFYVTNGVGEAFSTGEIKITATSASGDEVEVNLYTVDSSAYEANKNHPGTCDIVVRVDDVTAKYQVRILEPTPIAIEAEEDSSIEVDYYEGDVFNREGLLVYPITQTLADKAHPITCKDDLHPETSAADAAKIATRNYYEIEDADRPLVHGFNNFKITYFHAGENKTFTTTYSVYAKQREVKTVRVLKQKDPEGNDFTLPVGTREINPIDLEGLEVEVTLKNISYDNDARVITTTAPHKIKIIFDRAYLNRSKLLVKYDDVEGLSEKTSEISVNDVEFIFSPIKTGNNTVKICYGGYLGSSNEESSASFNVVGSLRDLSSLKTRFNKILAKYDANGAALEASTTLRARFNDIKEAISLKGQLSSLQGESEYVTAIQKLDLIIDRYNSDINGVNDAMSDSVKASTSFYYPSIINSGSTAFAILVALLLFVI